MWHLLTMCSAHFRVAKYPIKPPKIVKIVPIFVFQGLTSAAATFVCIFFFAVFCLWHAASVLIN